MRCSLEGQRRTATSKVITESRCRTVREKVASQLLSRSRTEAQQHNGTAVYSKYNTTAGNGNEEVPLRTFRQTPGRDRPQHDMQLHQRGTGVVRLKGSGQEERVGDGNTALLFPVLCTVLDMAVIRPLPSLPSLPNLR